MKNLLSGWNSILHHILKFFEPHEAIYLSQLTKDVYDGFHENFHFENTNEIILSFPWNLCTSEKRRKFWLSFRNIEILRIEPILASVLNAQDLYCLLFRSTQTLKSLYICSTCTPLLFNKSLVINRMKASDSNLNLDVFQEKRSSRIPIFQRCGTSHCNTDFSYACCYFDHSLSIEPYQTPLTLSCLTHIELSGNDCQLWSLTFLLWNLPKLQSLTLQPWTSDLLPFSSSYHKSYESCWTNDTHGHYHTRCYSGNLGKRPHEEDISNLQYITRKDTLNQTQCNTVDGKYFFKRSFKCLQRGFQGLLLFLSNVQNTVERIELIVPGNLSESFLWLFLGMLPLNIRENDMLEELDALFTIVENQLDPVRHDLMNKFLENWEFKTKNGYGCQDVSNNRSCGNNLCWNCCLQWFTRQLEGFVQIVRSILFCKTELTNVKTLCFLSVQGCSSGFYVLMKLLLQQSTYFLTLPDSANLLGFSNAQEKSFANFFRTTCISMSQDEFSSENSVTKHASTLRVSSDSLLNIFEKPLKEESEWMHWVLWHCEIVFCGIFTLPPKSCVKCKLYYPLCFNNGRIANFLHSYIFLSEKNMSHIVHEKDDFFLKNKNNVHEKFVQHYLKEKSCFINVTFDNCYELKVPREFQRLRRELLSTSWNTFLKPVGNQIRQKKKNPLVLGRCQPITFFNDINFYLDTFSDSLVCLEVHLNRDKGLFPQFSALSFESLKYLRIVDWNIVKCPSYTSLFDLTYCRVPCQLSLSLEFNHEYYNTVSEPAPIFQTIQKLVMSLYSRGCVVKSLTFCPCPVKSLAPYLANFFPITYLGFNPKVISMSYGYDLKNNTKKLSVPNDTSEKCNLMLTLGLDASFFQSLQLSSTKNIIPIKSFNATGVKLLLNENSFPLTQHMDGAYERLVSLLVALNKYRADCRSKGISENDNVCEFSSNATSSKCVYPKPVLKRMLLDNLSPSSQQRYWIACPEYRYSLQILTCKTIKAFMQTFDLLWEFLQSIITNVPFEAICCDVTFDSSRYNSANCENHSFRSCFNDVLFVPFLSLLKLNIPLRESILILRGIPLKYTRQFIKIFNNSEQGITIEWLPKQSKKLKLCDALILLRHPKHWSLAMSQWILKDFLSNEFSPFFVISNQILLSKKRKRLNTW